MLLAAATDLSVYYVGWPTLALLTAGIAQGKNRSGLNWFAITCIIGPLGTFLLVGFFPKHQPLIEHRLAP